MSTPFRPERAAAGASNPAGRQSETTGQTEARSGELAARDELARVIDPVAFQVQTQPKMWLARQYADRVLAAGYVRVQDDDETVRKVTNTLAGVDGWDIRWPRDGEEPEDILHGARARGSGCCSGWSLMAYGMTGRSWRADR